MKKSFSRLVGYVSISLLMYHFVLFLGEISGGNGFDLPLVSGSDSISWAPPSAFGMPWDVVVWGDANGEGISQHGNFSPFPKKKAKKVGRLGNWWWIFLFEFGSSLQLFVVLKDAFLQDPMMDSMWKFRRCTSISPGKHHPKTQGVWSLPMFVGISRGKASWPKNSSSYRKGGCKSMVDYTSLPNRNTWGGQSF